VKERGNIEEREEREERGEREDIYIYKRDIEKERER
jgi:hypothetical protein